MFYRLGWMEAMSWPEDKLRIMSLELVDKFPADQIPRRYKETYDLLKWHKEKNEHIDWSDLPTEE